MPNELQNIQRTGWDMKTDSAVLSYLLVLPLWNLICCVVFVSTNIVYKKNGAMLWTPVIKIVESHDLIILNHVISRVLNWAPYNLKTQKRGVDTILVLHMYIYRLTEVAIKYVRS